MNGTPSSKEKTLNVSKEIIKIIITSYSNLCFVALILHDKDILLYSLFRDKLNGN